MTNSKLEAAVPQNKYGTKTVSTDLNMSVLRAKIKERILKAGVVDMEDTNG
jgi:hypothetical protein